MTILEKLFLGILVVLALVFLRSVVKKSQSIAKQMLPPAPPAPKAPALSPGEPTVRLSEPKMPNIVIPELEEEVSAETAKRTEIHRRVKGYVQDKPRESTQLIRSWLLEDSYAGKE